MPLRRLARVVGQVRLLLEELDRAGVRRLAKVLKAVELMLTADEELLDVAIGVLEGGGNA